jgi:hypothetical protein
MTVQASAILARVRTQLIDELPTQRWSDDELLMWLSDGQRTLIAVDPALGDVTGPVKVELGTKQALPDGGFMLLDIKRNMGFDGLTPGRVITVITRENLDRVDPYWHASARSEVTLHYIYNPKEPRIYYIYPPSTGEHYIEAAVAMNPPDMAALTDTLLVPDLYQTALFDYVMFRAHQKDSDYSAGDQIAQGYLQLFQMFTATHTAAMVDQSPNKQLGPPDLTDKGAAA